MEHALSSIAARLQAVAGRVDSLGGVRSALLREFSAASTADLTGADDRARTALAEARRQYHVARTALAGAAWRRRPRPFPPLAADWPRPTPTTRP